MWCQIDKVHQFICHTMEYVQDHLCKSKAGFFCLLPATRISDIKSFIKLQVTGQLLAVDTKGQSFPKIPFNILKGVWIFFIKICTRITKFCFYKFRKKKKVKCIFLFSNETFRKFWCELALHEYNYLPLKRSRLF